MYNKTKFVLMLTGGLLGTWPVSAMECTTPPTCAELGFTKAVADCSGRTMLYCPFDKTKVYCNGETDCASLGFTDSIAQCPGTYSKCPADPTKGKCDFEASPGDLKYSLQTADHNGWLLCNGRSYTSAEYPELYAAISGSFGTKLPNYTNYFLKGAATSSASSFKTAEQAGLPNISASLSGGTSRLDAFLGDSLSASGAFSLSGTGSKEAIPQGGGSWGAQSLSFSASKSNSIYGRSTTVTPQNYKANVFIYAGRLGTNSSSGSGGGSGSTTDCSMYTQTPWTVYNENAPMRCQAMGGRFPSQRKVICNNLEYCRCALKSCGTFTDATEAGRAAASCCSGLDGSVDIATSGGNYYVYCS